MRVILSAKAYRFKGVADLLGKDPAKFGFTRFETAFLYTAGVDSDNPEVWAELPLKRLAIADLIPTQPTAEHGENHGGPIAVVRKRGKLYVIDGHNRLANAIRRGVKYIRAYVLDLPDAGATPEYMAEQFGARAVRQNREKGWFFDW